MTARRSFLFLQGVCSPFFAKLADRLQADGHRVFKVNFNVGDVAYWLPRPAVSFSGRLDALAEFLCDQYQRLGITDQVLFGDRRPIHTIAVEQARLQGVRNHVFEEGYFRPHWVTLEREGVNAHSLLPRDPAWFLAVGAGLPEYRRGTSFSSPFALRAAHDVAYHAACALDPLLFPHYRTHAPVNAAVQYMGYSRRLPMLRYHAPRDKLLIDGLIRDAVPYYVLPLQLSSDAQIRDHSRFADMDEVMWFVIESFAKQAPGNAKLVIKNHPLDLGLAHYGRTVGRLSRHFGVQGRVHFIETGDLTPLLKHARGTVTVNSTVGGVALGLACPTISLSDPIYNLPGLTFQGDLDAFWNEAAKPDAHLFKCFRSTVIHAAQLNGGFYCKPGIELAVANSCRVLEAERSPLEELL